MVLPLIIMRTTGNIHWNSELEMCFVQYTHIAPETKLFQATLNIYFQPTTRTLTTSAKCLKFYGICVTILSFD